MKWLPLYAGWANLMWMVPSGEINANPLPPQRPDRQYSYYDKELRRQITYPRSAKDEKGKYPHVTEEECLERAEHQDTDLRRDAYWKD